MEQFDMPLVAECMQEAFARGKTFSFMPNGISMLPTIQSGKYTVTFAECTNPRIGDIVFYKRQSGRYILHRIVGKARGAFMLCGDNERSIEYPVFQDAMFAKVVAVKDEHGKPVHFQTKRNIRRLWLKKLKLHVRIRLKK